ncbi:MAG TPA: hypothetical protein VGA22_09780 [Gemmatimonadales bacterium]
MRHPLPLMTAAMLFMACQSAPPPESEAPAVPAGPEPGTPEWTLQNAMSAAPPSISASATIMAWPATEGGEMTQVRAGTNGWTCMPDMPGTPDNDPMCVDATWLALFQAWQGRQPFTPTATGIAYMLQGGSGASDTDPYKMEPDPGQSWLVDPPHLMLILPNVGGQGLPTERSSGGPYVMWHGTPYAHVMVPIR